ncbi:MAG TPA: NEW3 domain-containing protein [Candidatus Binatia bacterium]
MSAWRSHPRFGTASFHLPGCLRLLLLVFAIVLGPAADILSAAQPLRPGEVELEGTLEVLHEDRHTGSRYLHFLNTATERLELRFAKNPPALETGQRVKARGKKSKGVLALDSGSSVQTLSAALSNTFGAQKTLVILVNFQDKTTQPYTVAYAQGVVDTTSNFDLENSFQQTSLDADVVGWYTIAQNSTVCNYTNTADLAEQAAQANGVDVSAYPRRVYAFPDTAACNWWGLGSVGGNPSKAWINGSFQLRVLGHEMGHNFGLYHSKSLSCDTTACIAQEYGDRWDIMGNPAFVNPGHFTAFQKERLGWLNFDDGIHVMPPITTVTTDGVYSIGSYESQDSNPKALKILKSTDPSTGKRTYYYVEHRAGSSDTLLPWAVVLHTGSESSADSSYMWDLDQTTVATDWELSVSQTYSDSAAQVAIALMSADSTGATINVTTGQAPCVQSNPTVSLSPSAAQTISAGNSAVYSVTVTNGDNSSCSSSSFNLTAAAPNDWTAVAGAYSLSVAPGESASTSLQVSSPSTASAGGYSFSVTATNSSDANYTSTALGAISIFGCTQVNPTITFSPSGTTSLAAGDTASYSLTVANNDSSACSASSFSLVAVAPSGWTATSGVSTLTIAPGGSATTTLQVTAPNTASTGSYSFSVTAANDSSSGHAGTASGTISIVGCTRANPTVVINGPGWLAPEDFIYYGILVINNDSTSCGSSDFNLSSVVPNGWPASSIFRPTLTIPPAGGRGTTNVYVSAPLGATVGNYSFSVTASNSVSPAYSTTTHKPVSVISCTRQNPIVTLSPGTAWVIGTTGTYTLTVTNNDSSGCPGVYFLLDYSAPWLFGPTPVPPTPTLAPGASYSYTFQMVARPEAVDGALGFKWRATHPSTANHQTWANATQMCCSGQLAITATSDKTSYKRGSLVTSTVNVRLGTTAISGASVTTKILSPTGALLATLAGITDASGNAVFKYQLATKAVTGAYKVNGSAATNGYSGSATASFSVTTK